MRPSWKNLLSRVEKDGRAALVTIVAAQGSTPREVGARMIVTPNGQTLGTIGGGTLEYRVIGVARSALQSQSWSATLQDVPLGPDLGQCCGGRLSYLVETFQLSDRDHLVTLASLETERAFSTEGRLDLGGHLQRRILDEIQTSEPVDVSGHIIRESFTDDRSTVLLFGAGHIGRAVTIALAPLPFRIRWIDSRDDAFPALMPQNVSAVQSADMTAEIRNAPAGAFLLVMTHSHPLDLAIVSAALKRSDLPYVGLIGSETKKARFMRRLTEAGLGEAARRQLVSPIGLPSISGKEPAIIAASIAADLLIRREAMLSVSARHNHGSLASPSLDIGDHPHE